eukprot:TRINITY_DN1655_c0_g1_i1.p1 TRINITY_DN1655_c0_g1~~TRINITY_DN1655_c0_g1_i1.p1  ORF type:complete len:597 (+),score=86.45 TRINITY_DN1655_c0_g1_i1:162-1793(+)
MKTEFDAEYKKRFRKYGHVPGIQVGQKFSCRAELSVVGVHDAYVRGIDYQNHQPAFAICLSGAYADDLDQGDFFSYTGEGGQKKGIQVFDQEKNNGNLALIKSYEQKVPVRVIRGGYDENKTLYYFYDGLFMVESYSLVESQQDKHVSQENINHLIQQLKENGKNKNFKTSPKVYKFNMRGISGHCHASKVIQYRYPLQRIQLARNNIKLSSLKFHPFLSAAEFKKRDDQRFQVLQQKASKKEIVILREDLSEGQERVRIPVIASKEYLDQNVAVPDVKYTNIKNDVWSENARKLFDEHKVYAWNGCGIFHREKFRGQVSPDSYNEGGCLMETDFCGIFECNMSCTSRGNSCNANKVVQKGLFLPLEVRYFGEKGFGITCSVDIPLGSFVCEYVGVVITDSEAEQRKGNDKYLFDLNHFITLHNMVEDRPSDKDFARMPPMPEEYKDKDKNLDLAYLVVDAEKQGNVGRFINHSCSPNLSKQTVFCQDDSFLSYRVGFFAHEDIKAGTELCYDYFWKPIYDQSKNDGMVYCKCGAKNCRGRLL